VTKKAKLLQKLKNNPKNIRFEEIDNLLVNIGFTRRQPSKGSSHYTYTLEGKSLTIPFNRPFVKVVYIKLAVKILDELGI
jgi:hypothetical protein